MFEIGFRTQRKGKREELGEGRKTHEYPDGERGTTWGQQACKNGWLENYIGEEPVFGFA